MTEQNQPSEYDQLTHLVESYLGLESMDVIEELLELCGVRIDGKALPLLKRRLEEEDVQMPLLEARGYIRMSEKSQQLLNTLKPLIAVLEQSTQHTGR